MAIVLSLTGLLENSDFTSVAGKQLDAARQWHILQHVETFDLTTTGTPVASVKGLPMPRAGVLTYVGIGAWENGTTGSFTIALTNGGNSMITPITINGSSTDKAIYSATLDATYKTFVAGSPVQIELTVSSPTQAGPFIVVRWEQQGS